MIIRLRYLTLGGHTHVRVFAGPREGAVSKCGDLVFRNDEWLEFRARLRGVEARLEDDDYPPRNRPPADADSEGGEV
jgi:hypothetical protein